MQPQITTLILAAAAIFSVLGIVSVLSHKYSLNSIKSKTVGDGQFGTARFASGNEIRKTYRLVKFEVKNWRRGKNLPDSAGIVVGCRTALSKTCSLVDPGDVHAIMIGAAGVGKTAFFLYPNLEYACASGTSFITSDTKGDLYRNYGAVAKEYYGYDVAVIDLRNPTRSDEYNILNLVNKYMDEYRDSDYQLWFEDYLTQNGFRQESIHTSGHASIADIKKIITGLNPKKIIPIHTMTPTAFSALSERTELKEDGKEFEV